MQRKYRTDFVDTIFDFILRGVAIFCFVLFCFVFILFEICSHGKITFDSDGNWFYLNEILIGKCIIEM